MRNLNQRKFMVRKKRNDYSEATSFVSKAEIELARRELVAAGIESANFSDEEISIALQKKEEVAAHTIVPVMIDWFIRKDFILSSKQAIHYLGEKKQQEKSASFRSIGAPECDRKGKFFLIALLTESSQVERFYKVYTDGTIQELWTE